jgi:hypothetical protein
VISLIVCFYTLFLFVDITTAGALGCRSIPKPGVAPTITSSNASRIAVVADDFRGVLEVEGVEMLMGFPPGTTAAPQVSKSARFKMLGDAVPHPLSESLADRLVKLEAGQLRSIDLQTEARLDLTYMMMRYKLLPSE